MDKIEYVSEERKQQLDKMFEKEIIDLKNNIITRETFIIYIKSKNISFMDFCYLISEYSKVKIICYEDNFVKPELLNREILISEDVDEISYKEKKQNTYPKIYKMKKIKKYQGMSKR